MNAHAMSAVIGGTVVHGDGRGKALGYPTANLDTVADPSLHGIYAGLVRIAGDGPWHPATISIGDNPTFRDAANARVECYIHDWTEDLYGLVLEVALVRFIRPMGVFSDVDELVRRSAEDVQVSRRILAQRADAGL